MIILISGTKDSGKSKLAEDLVLNLSDMESRIYIATMIPYDEEGQKRIEKHRKNREGKGFVTFEIPYEIAAVADTIHDSYNKTALIECMSNLVGNEIYENKKHSDILEKSSSEEYEDKLDKLTLDIIKDITTVTEKFKNTVIVTNRFEYSDDYDFNTKLYIKATELVNEKLIKLADKVEYL